MDFDFSDDQDQLRDAVRKWVDKGYDFERRRKAVKAGGFDRAAYGQLAELGLTGLYVAEDQGGMGMGPVEASRQALSRAGMSIGDMDLIEINEAFAVQVLASMDDLGIDPDKLNVHGGAIALGHPFGATGARITTTLLNGLAARDAQFGLETMCIGGGQGMAVIYERLS